MPSGTKLVAEGAMDNSDRNPGNPDPTRPVFFGLQTMHEMFFGLRRCVMKATCPGTRGSNEETSLAARCGGGE